MKSSRNKQNFKFGGTGGTRTLTGLVKSQMCSQLHHGSVKNILRGDRRGSNPLTPHSQCGCYPVCTLPHLSILSKFGGAGGIRTPDLDVQSLRVPNYATAPNFGFIQIFKEQYKSTFRFTFDITL